MWRTVTGGSPGHLWGEYEAERGEKEGFFVLGSDLLRQVLILGSICP